MKALDNIINAFKIFILCILVLGAVIAFMDWALAFFNGLGATAWQEGQRFMMYSITFLGLEAITRKK